MFLSPSRARFVSSVQKCRRINKEDVIQKVPRIAAAAARAASLAPSVLSCVVVAAANVDVDDFTDRVFQWKDFPMKIIFKMVITVNKSKRPIKT